MALFRQSRYADVTTTNDLLLNNADGTVVRTLFRSFRSSGTTTIAYYVWQDGDRLDRIAALHFGDPARWWEILDANPEINNGASIPPGTKIRLPNA